VDNWFWESASLSPYKACEHGCNYCDGRSRRYHASEDFDNLIYVKINAVDVLKKELDKLFPRQRTLSDFELNKPTTHENSKMVVAVSSGISDAYQQAEMKYNLTRNLLKLLCKYEIPTYVMTKSDLVLRDLDILKEINEKVWCNVSFSFSTINKKIAAIFEPKASSPKKRLEAMKKISDAGILTGVTFMPIIPYITDSKDQIEDTIKASKEHDAKYILAASMTTRDRQSERFYDTIKKHYPDLEKKYKLLYSKGYQPHGKYLKDLYRNLTQICKKHDIQQYIPRYIPNIELKRNLEISTDLFLISYFLGIKGEGFKAEKYRKLARTIEDLDENIENIYKKGTLNLIKGLGKEPKTVIEELLETGKSQYLEKLKES
jgi:DNA repair photolyase